MGKQIHRGGRYRRSKSPVHVLRTIVPVVTKVLKREVLVVDDDQASADSERELLAAEGYLTRVAYSPEKALELIKERAPDVLITDLMMPGINGLGLAQEIFNLAPQCPVILYSGDRSQLEIIRTSMPNTATFCVLQKPVHPLILISTVRTLLLGRV